MKKLICHIVDKTTKNHLGIDQYIAEKSGWNPSMGMRGMNPKKVAAFRGLYDQNALEIGSEPLISDNVINPTKEQLDKAYEKLMNFRDGMRHRHAVKIANSKKHLDRDYDNLRHVYSLDQRKLTVNTVSLMFSQEVDRLMGNNLNVSRQDVVNGFRTTNGEICGGSVSIFNAVYDRCMTERQRYYENMLNSEQAWQSTQQRVADAKLPNAEHPEDRYLLNYKDAPKNAQEYKKECENMYNAYTKLLENWQSILPFVMKDLVNKEGVKLGIKKEYMTVASSDAYSDNDIAAKWDMSEAIREGWQRNNDLESAFGSVGQQVRRILSTIYEVESEPVFEVKNGRKVFKGINTVPIHNELGFPTFKNPIQVHQFLSEFLKGVKDSDDLMKRLIKPGTDEATIPWLQPLVNLLTGYGLPDSEKNRVSQIRTQLFVDFKKNFQPYSIMFEDKENSDGLLKKINTRVINKSKNLLRNKYDITISPKGKYPANVKMWGFTPVFEEGVNGGKVNWERLAELRSLVLKWTHEEVSTQPGIFGSRKQYKVSPSLLTDPRHDTMIEIDGEKRRITYNMKRDFLMEVFTSLGYDVTVDAVDSILNSKDIYTIREQLEQLFNYENEKTGIVYALNGKMPKSFRNLSDPKVSAEEKKASLKILQDSNKTWRSIYNTITKETAKGPMKPVREHSEKILDIINNHQEGRRVESRARYMGNTMYSFVNPSYLGDRLEEIGSFVNENDHEGLLNYLKNEYLQSSFFVDDEYIATNGEKGKILNLWLSDLVDACKNKKANLADTVASIFTYERDLGSTDKKFEDFTSKEHATDMLIHFFADEQQNKGYDSKKTNDLDRKLSALYPVFILGDAGVSKYIRAPRITSHIRVDSNGKELSEEDKINHSDKVIYRFNEAAKEKVIDAFWNIYLQEKRRMALDDAMPYDMYANGKKVKHSKSEFGFLSFLNPTSQEYIPEYRIPDGTGSKFEKDLSYDEQKVKEVIRKYLENSTLNNLKRADGSIIPSFKQRLSDLGLLETVKNSRGKQAYRFLNSVMTPENIDEKLTEFYWNTKLATAQQLQLMTLSPSFYHNTKDLQKRYKEVHAPGNVLDILAKDFDGNLYSSDGIERCVYFKDLALNAEETNPEFMESILRIFAKPGVDVDAAIKEGVLVPKTGSEETARQNRLVDILGNDMFKKVYAPYTANTLTDGQGYRTLTSYRRVMGMAGKWTQDMERAYNRIMEIREKHSDGSDLISDELKEIANFALVLQPIKPYMFTHEKFHTKIQKTDGKGNKSVDPQGNPVWVNDVQYIPVQHKYAEALIIPELMPKGSKLRDLGLWMDEHNIDVVGSDKIAKVGCFGQSDLSSIKSNSDLISAMNTGYVHELSYRDYRIQTNVPEHINASQLFGTQVRKLIMAGLTMNKDYSFYLDGQTVNLSTDGVKNLQCSLKGKNLLALYNSLICANIFDSYGKFEQNAKDIDIVSEMLQQSTVGSTRESMDNLFSYVVTGNEDKLKQFMIPLFEGGLEHDAAAMLLSTFKRIVNKQQISGGSAVQVSAFGINGYSEDGGLRFVQDPDNKANILYAEIEMPFDKSFVYDVTNKDGSKSKQTVSLPYDKYCYQDGNLIPTGKAIEKGTKEWKKYQSYTYKEVDGKLVPCEYNDANAKVYKPLIEEDYPDILSILAYRIPSESDYSMINCKIKRFTSKMAGGTLKVPSQGTTIAGFDFDIDKLYFMQREYHKKYNDSSYVESKFSESNKNTIWANIYQNNDELRNALERARSEAEANNPTLLSTKTLRNGRVITMHKTALNAYYDQVNGQEITGMSKHEIFAKKAQEMDIVPTQNLVAGERIEEMDSYDFNKTPEENTRACRNNLLISLIQARLMDPETAKQRYTPGGFEDAKKTARLMRELKFGDLSGMVNGNTINLNALKERQDSNTDPEPNYSAIDPYTILVYNQQNQVAGKLIGIFANQNTHNAFVSCMDEFELKEPIDFCGHYGMKDLLHKDSSEAARVNLNVSQFLAASVDAVKDPVLNFMNLNIITADPAAMLARLGYNMDEIGMFFNQPVIVDICQESFNTGKNVRTIISDMQEKLKGALVGSQVNQKTNLSLNDLAMSIVNERLYSERGESHEKFLTDNARLQYAVLDLFSKVLKASQDVSDFVLNTKFTAANAVSSTFGGLYAQQLRVNRYLDKFNEDSKGNTDISYKVVVSKINEGTGLMNKPLDNSDTLTTMSEKDYLHYVRFNPFAYEQAMYDTNRKALKLLSKYFPYETDLYKNVRSKMQGLSRYGTLNEDEINAIHSNLPVALLSMQTASEFHGEGLHMKKDADGNYKKTTVTNRQYYREDFGGDLTTAIGEDPNGLGKLEIFKFLTPESETVELGRNPDTNLPVFKDRWKITMQDVGGLDAETKEAIKESWAYLMEVDDEGNFKNPKYAEIGKDLFMYCYYQMGFEFSPISFMHLAPTAVKDNIKVERESSLSLNSFEEGNIKWDNENSNDVLVWSANVPGSMERFAADFDVNRSLIGELQGKVFRLDDNLSHYSVLDLVNTAISHPELRFKIDRNLSQEEFNLFSRESLGKDVPANIYFSKDTLDNISEESKGAVSYGKERTYRQFLEEILKGKIEDIDMDDFAKQWILNHLDNPKFVLDLNRTNATLRKVLMNQAKQSLAQDRNKIVFDLSSLMGSNDMSSALKSIVKVESVQGKIINASWCPCILYNGSFYMAEGNDKSGFNVNQSSSMTYTKVTPLGSTKSLEYDNTKKMAPSMRYQAYYGETNEDLSHAEYVRTETPTLDTAESSEDNTSEVSLENRDPSSVIEALNNIKQFANDNDFDTSKDWDAIQEQLLNLDLREEVKDAKDYDVDEVWDAVENIVKGRAWRKSSEEMKETLISAIFDYNKNPTYLPTESPVQAEDPNANTTSLTIHEGTRQYLEEAIAREFIAAVEMSHGEKMLPEDIEGLKRQIHSSSDQDIMDTINDLKEACRKDGVVMLDKDGNMMKGC